MYLYVIEVKVVHATVATVRTNVPVVDSETITTLSLVALQIPVSFYSVQGRKCRRERESEEFNTAIYVRFEFIEFLTFLQ
jgi:hypothetical protein